MKPPQPSGSLPPYSPWPHRVALVMVCATFPLIWVGGLVTTYDAGMAVPDWPTTYNHGMFSYPWQRWLSGPWDLFVEHGHRQLGAIVGLLTIAFVGVVCAKDRRTWVRWLAVGCLVAVIGQGVLGGVRVLRDDPRVAMIHGCTGPLFFCLTVFAAAVTSRWWRAADRIAAPNPSPSGPPHDASRAQRRPLSPLAWLVFGLAVGQLVLGAQLRHAPIGGHPGTFRIMVLFHIAVAVLLLVHIVLLSTRVLSRGWRNRLLRRPAWGLLAIVQGQIALGVATWVVKYNWPAWMHRYEFARGVTVQAEGLGQSVIVTAHVAMGSLLLAVVLLLAARLSRLEYAPGRRLAATEPKLRMGMVL